jgi:hypothetical protein
MITEEAYSYFFKIKLDGKLTYEMGPGSWETISCLVLSLITQYLTER